MAKASSLNNCSCGREPKLMRSGSYIFYQCCGVMGSFPGSEDEQTAKEMWNINNK